MTSFYRSTEVIEVWKYGEPYPDWLEERVLGEYKHKPKELLIKTHGHSRGYPIGPLMGVCRNSRGMVIPISLKILDKNYEEADNTVSEKTLDFLCKEFYHSLSPTRNWYDMKPHTQRRWKDLMKDFVKLVKESE